MRSSVVDGVNAVVDGVNPVVDGVNAVVDGVNPVVDGVNPVVDGVNAVVDGVNEPCARSSSAVITQTKPTTLVQAPSPVLMPQAPPSAPARSGAPRMPTPRSRAPSR